MTHEDFKSDGKSAISAKVKKSVAIRRVKTSNRRLLQEFKLEEIEAQSAGAA